MPTCNDFDGLRTQLVDAALDAAGRERLSAHLRGCPACAADVDVQRAVRDLLHAHADRLREAAPVALRSRLQAAARTPGVVVPFAPAAAAPPVSVPAWRRLRTRVPASVAAALVLAVSGIVFAGAFGPRGGVLAAQLALDHLKCRLIASVSPGVSPSTLEEAWSRRYGWEVSVPASSPEIGVALVGMRNCLYHDGTMAHVLYDYRGHRLSLFVMPHAERAGGEIGVLGQRTVTWEAGGRMYALVASDPGADLSEVERYMRGTAR